MNILLCHNHYQHPGGEDQTFVDEARLLESRGHQVVRYTLHNDDIRRMSFWEVARKTLWNREAYDEVRSLIRRHRPRVMHCTNTFPLISPAAYYAARDEGVPVVQSLHNYRMLCANALFLRRGAACESCLGKRLPWPAVLHGCYRESRVASAGVASMVALHRLLKTWVDTISLYCTPSEFARQKFIQGGLAADKIVVKPNFVYEDPGTGQGGGGYCVFAGRLSHEKGIDLLLNAWQQLPHPVQLKIVGDGPQADRVAEAARRDPRIQWLGRRTSEEVASIIGDAACVVLPSICYETFGRAVIEAYCKGTPVVASDHGAIAELVHDGRTGLLFAAGQSDQLQAKLTALLDGPRQRTRMRREARREYEDKYTAPINYGLLSQIYARVLDSPAGLGGCRRTNGHAGTTTANENPGASPVAT